MGNLPILMLINVHYNQNNNYKSPPNLSGIRSYVTNFGKKTFKKLYLVLLFISIGNNTTWRCPIPTHIYFHKHTVVGVINNWLWPWYCWSLSGTWSVCLSPSPSRRSGAVRTLGMYRSSHPQTWPRRRPLLCPATSRFFFSWHLNYSTSMNKKIT